MTERIDEGHRIRTINHKPAHPFLKIEMIYFKEMYMVCPYFHICYTDGAKWTVRTKKYGSRIEIPDSKAFLEYKSNKAHGHAVA